MPPRKQNWEKQRGSPQQGQKLPGVWEMPLSKNGSHFTRVGRFSPQVSGRSPISDAQYTHRDIYLVTWTPPSWCTWCPGLRGPKGKAAKLVKRKPFDRGAGKISSPVRGQPGRSVYQASETEIWLVVGRQAERRGTAARLTWWIRKGTKELQESGQLKQSKTWKGNRSAHLYNLSIKQSSTCKGVLCPEQWISQHAITAVMERQAHKQELIIIITRNANNFG